MGSDGEVLPGEGMNGKTAEAGQEKQDDEEGKKEGAAGTIGFF